MSAISYLCDERLSSAAQEPSMHAPHMHLPTTYHPSDPGLGCAKARFIQGVWSALKDPKCNMYVCGIYRDIRGWMWHARGPGRTQAAPKHQAAQPANFLDIEGPRRRFHIAQLRYEQRGCSEQERFKVPRPGVVGSMCWLCMRACMRACVCACDHPGSAALGSVLFDWRW